MSTRSIKGATLVLNLCGSLLDERTALLGWLEGEHKDRPILVVMAVGPGVEKLRAVALPIIPDPAISIVWDGALVPVPKEES